MFNLRKSRIGVVGLGYVGLPLAVEFGRKFKTTGFDLKVPRIKELAAGKDSTLEVDRKELKSATHLTFTADVKDLRRCNVFIVTVPTPIDDYKRPDLTPLEKASASLGTVLKKGDIVIYESTVYPGCTEEICIPILEKVSGLKFNKDFFAGYSPERINPGDKQHRLPTIKKVTSGSTPEVADFVDELYRSIITAGTHKASSLKVAEAAKVIENTQRDVNIALINELALIFNRLGIDTEEVLIAAGTKWNFLPFRPGLVGGHCIGVDPYYLTHKAQEIGYNPEMILAGRRLNDNMALYVAGEVVKLLTSKRHPCEGRPHPGAGPHVQGKLPGPSQLEGDRHHPRAREVRRKDGCVRSLDRCQRSQARVRRGAHAQARPHEIRWRRDGRGAQPVQGAGGARRAQAAQAQERHLRHQACVQARPD